MLLSLDALDTYELFTLVSYTLGLLLVGENIELLTCCRSSVKTEH